MCRTHSIRKFIKNIRTIKFSNNEIIVLLKVNYGKGFINEGIYVNRTELLNAFKAFTEKD